MDLFEDVSAADRDRLLRYLLTEDGTQQLAKHLDGGGTFATFAGRWAADDQREALRVAGDAVMSLFEAAGRVPFRGLPGLTMTEVARRLSTLSLSPPASQVVVGDVLDALTEQHRLVSSKRPGAVDRWKLP